MKRFGMIGVAGYVAPRHLRAIKETGNTLIVCFDPHDSVGIIDQYFPHADYFQSYERFERSLSKLSLLPETKLDYLTICSPNYLHDSHIRLALNYGIDAICEKPLLLFPGNLDVLQEQESKSGKKVYTVMQLRNHPSIISLKEKLSRDNSGKKKKVILTYITPRGNWYHYSWKGEKEKSGGLAANIGIHLFDLLIWLFGTVKYSEINFSSNTKMAGYLELENAEVSWFLSIDKNDLLKEDVQKKSFRILKIDNEVYEFSEGFADLHTKVYEEILAGRGMGIDDARPSIELVYNIRTAQAIKNRENFHSYLRGIE